MIQDTDDNQSNISDDQELAKALAGVSNIIETQAPEPEPEPQVVQVQGAAPLAIDLSQQAVTQTPEPTPIEETSPDADLEAIKGAAIQELRPLIGKLVLPADEKFDTYLLLIRSTDDETLIPPAYETARQIEDEARRAMALLDIIKEIDYLTNRTNIANDNNEGGTR